MKAIFVPTVKEAEGIFPGIELTLWKHGVFKAEYNDIMIFVTGAAKTCAAFSTAMVLGAFPVEEAILTGICGAYRQSGLKVGDVVSVHKDFFADEAVFYSDKITTLGEMGFGFAKEGCCEFASYGNLPIVDSNTVSFLDGEGAVSALLYSKYGASVENMEGAAFGFVCNTLGIKAYQVRAVSNFCGKRDGQEWNVRLALGNLKRLFE
jgi:futalosine hydrolase